MKLDGTKRLSSLVSMCLENAEKNMQFHLNQDLYNLQMVQVDTTKTPSKKFAPKNRMF